MSPSSRGRGLKFIHPSCRLSVKTVALFTRAWIEITNGYKLNVIRQVALFARAWIEITPNMRTIRGCLVALFARAWIEMVSLYLCQRGDLSRPLCEGVD